MTCRPCKSGKRGEERKGNRESESCRELFCDLV